MCFPEKNCPEEGISEIKKFRSLQEEEKFWNKDLYDNRVIFNPYTAAD
jgi:hypothetical protein